MMADVAGTKTAVDQHHECWTGTLKQCNEDFVVNEITIFKKSLNSCIAATAAAVGGEVWDYYPVASTSSSCSSSACSPTINTSTTNDNILSSIVVRRVASIVDDEVKQDSLTTALADPITSSSIITMDTTIISRKPPSPNAAPISSTTPSQPQQQLEEEKEEEIPLDNLENAKRRLYQILISLLQGTIEEQETIANNILFMLEQLQGKAIQQIRHQQRQPPPEEDCKIPCRFNKSIPRRKELVRQFHQLIQHWFPLVQVDTSTTDTIHMKINTIFFDLIPYLLSPLETLIPLYRLRFCTERSTDATNNTNGIKLTLIPEVATKDIRRWIHTKLSSTCRSMRTSTETSNIIVVQRHPQSTNNKRKRTTSTTAYSPASENIRTQQKQLHLLCIVKKAGMEHLRCIQTLAQALSCSISDIGTAGIKDKCAITTQFITFRNVTPSRLQNVHLPPNIQILMDKKWTTTMLSPGMLFRNQFDIILRDIQVTKSSNSSTQPLVRDVIDQCVRRMKVNGFINFYGEQRVGITTDTIPIQSYIGRAILRQDFWTAIDYIIRGKDVETTLTADDIDEEDKNRHEISQVAATMARKVWYDTQDPVAVLKILPKGGFTREKIILKGLKRFGKQEPLAVWRCLPYHIRSFYVNAYQSYVWNTVTWERLRRFGAQTVLLGDLYYGTDGAVQVVTEPSHVPFSSIVHPLPGADVRYPDNEIGDIYHEILQKDGINFNGKDAPVESTVKGTYRLLHANAHNLEWGRIVGDGEDEEDIVRTAKFKFELDSGCYATVMLRQLMKPIL